MREFFRGWRRKAGSIALLGACLLTAIWIRSEQTVETLIFHRDEGSRHYLNVSRDGLTWSRRWGSGQHVVLPKFLNVSWQSTKPRDAHFDATAYGWRVEHEWQCCGFQFAEYELGTSFLRLAGMGVWRIPFWSVVLPLTLLSAYLLVSKPRPGKPPEATNLPDEAELTHA